jgi:hypothetical protein
MVSGILSSVLLFDQKGIGRFDEPIRSTFRVLL